MVMNYIIVFTIHGGQVVKPPTVSNQHYITFKFIILFIYLFIFLL